MGQTILMSFFSKTAQAYTLDSNNIEFHFKNMSKFMSLKKHSLIMTDNVYGCTLRVIVLQFSQ